MKQKPKLLSNSKIICLTYRLLCVISDKRRNSEGLQFADIIARPIGLSVLRPEQPNRAFTILKEKIYQEQESFVYPLKAKDPKVVLEAQAPVG